MLTWRQSFPQMYSYIFGKNLTCRILYHVTRVRTSDAAQILVEFRHRKLHQKIRYLMTAGVLGLDVVIEIH